MKRIAKLLFIFPLILLISSCFSENLPASYYAATNNKIAVISVLDDDTFSLTYVSLKSASVHADIRSWDINTYIEKNLGEKLRDVGKMPVFIDNRNGISYVRSPESIFQSVSTKTDADTIIIITPVPEDPRNIFPPGLGLYEGNFLGHPRRDLYVAINYSVYYRKTGTRIAYYSAPLYQTRIPMTVPYTKLNTVQIMKLEPQVHDLINTLNGKALKKMAFI